MVDGHWCHVLERKGQDCLWIDTVRGFALLALETHSRESGALAQRFELTEHEEIHLGVWFPKKIRNIQYDANAPTEQRRARKVRDAVLTVIHVTANDVGDGAFEFHPPPGSLLLRSDGHPVQAVPGGVDHLDNLAEWVRKHGTRRAPRSKYLAYLPPLALVCIVVAYEVYCRRKTIH